MKLISLNTWGGKMRKPLLSFLEEHAPSTDIFCFQEIPQISFEDREKAIDEVGDNWLQQLTEALPEFEPHFAVTHHGFNWRKVEFGMSFGNVVFVRNNLRVLAHDHIFVHREKNALDFLELHKENWNSIPRLVQRVRIVDDSEKEIDIFNFHGLWYKGGKGDVPERIEQSKKILDFMSKTAEPKILCGDFNLNIDSKSLEMLEENMRNLIKEFDIKTTRSKELYPRFETMPFADYTLVSKDIEVKSFSVPDLPISDHLPMILEFR